ncbi:hypothetical protein HFP57_15265 [Parasphingopyxis algicola]|uniref:hypothetical protein n=1 Tax=Parasphingopyxis algicola TaxID=2026624 RepID=UPI0015A0269C|nr:hypothetical protein [Parasphingopyxis algicola]QLC26252.1 hypothetical protein HFP57_15265 [Parasphingopyxis algicola]
MQCPKIGIAALLALSCTASAHQASDPAAPARHVNASHDFAGEWEGEIETPRWPLYVSMRIAADGAGPHELVALGSIIPLTDFRTTEDGIALTVDGPWEAPPEISLARNADALSGFWHEGGDDMPVALTPIPDYPEPANRQQAWLQDIDALSNRFLRFDRTLSPSARREFLERMANVSAGIAERTDPEIMIALSRAVALSGNAHTRLYLLRRKTVLDRLPIRLWWFGDELRIVRASDQYAHYLGCRVETIAGVDPETAREAAATAFAGNDSWTDYKSVYFLTSADALTGLGIVDTNPSVAFDLSDCATEGSVVFQRQDTPRSEEVIEAWHDLTPLAETEPGWQQVLERNSQLPDYLSRPDQNYWYRRFEDSGLLYVQINRAEAMDAESISDFGERLLADLREDRPAALALDVRFNTGGDGSLFEELMAALEEESRGLARFVITGRATFSAGLTIAARWQEAGDVTIVGEPVGDALDYWAEGGNIILPNSGISAHFANGAHSYSPAPCPDQTYCFDLSIDDLQPDLPVDMTWAQYVAGRDPALDAIVARIGG